MATLYIAYSEELFKAEDLRKIYRADTEESAKEGILRLKERWGKIYPKVVKKWEDKAYALLY
jgi:transposase-like protein